MANQKNSVTKWFELEMIETLEKKGIKELEMNLKDLKDLQGLLEIATKYKFYFNIAYEDATENKTYARLDFSDKLVCIDTNNASLNIVKFVNDKIQDIENLLNFRNSKINYTPKELELIKRCIIN